MDNWIQKLNNHINENATFVVINRSTVYLPEIVSQDNKHFELECMGTAPEPYEVNVWEASNSRVYSDCTCPYEGEGICKHQVAAVNRLINLAKSGKIQIDENGPGNRNTKKPKSKNLLIPCENGVLDIDYINNLNFNSGSYYYSDFKFINLDEKKVEGRYDDFRFSYTQELTYHKSKSEAKLTCSCGGNMTCSHKIRFLREFIDLFGPKYFSKDYRDNLKKEILKEKNLDGKVKFDDVFELKIEPIGVSFIEKVPNVVIADDNLLKLFEGERKHFYLPNEELRSSEPLGVGICLEFSGRSLSAVYPFTGKLNKAKTEIKTKLREISEIDLTDTLATIPRKKDQDFILEAIKLAEIYSDQYDSEIDPAWMNEVYEKTHKAFDLLEENPIYLYKNRKSFVKKNVKELNLNKTPLTPVIKVKENEKFFQLDFKIKSENKNLKVNSNQVLITELGIVLGDNLHLYSSPEEATYLMYAARKIQLNVLNQGLESLRNNVLQPLSSVFEIDFDLIKTKEADDEELDFEKQVYLSDEEGEYIILQPVVKYGEYAVSPGSKEKIWTDKEGFEELSRSRAEEQEFIDFLRDLHPNFKHKTDFFYLTPEEALESMWLMETIDKLKDENVSVFGMNELKSIRYNLNKPNFSVQLSSGTDWFDMKIDIKFGDQSVDLKSLQKSIINKSNYVELKDGSIGILPKEWIEKYKKYFKLGQVKKDEIEISNFQFNIIDELYEDLTNTPKFLEELYEKKKRINNLKDLKSIAPPKGLKAELRSYQQEGLNWMVCLHENKLGGCLADDMGLGKTLQTIAFLMYLKAKTPKAKRKPSLVVAPTSLMFNWLAEIEKFAPKLKTLTYIGAKRKDLREKFPENDIILTTYGSLIKDIEFHKNQHYFYVILDESQAIKNPQSQRFKAARLLQCENRFALTGTPIENNTFDLYSQFNFLNPGIFGSVKNFRANFSDAIDKEQDAETSQLLSRMIHPFILRRTKAQVATELPPKTEGVIYCEMEKNQRKVYDEFKKHFRQKLLEQIESEGVNRSQMYILQGLTKLRQICNSTALADKEKDYGNYSVKLDELVRHLKEKVNQHKVLVFSQFVGMLQIVKNRLEKEGIQFEYLDGQTRNREEKVNEFQNNADIRVFLISLKAGGTGLNLTEADYVYLIDPWWNPAVESQAIDRCYRIGQDKKVMAYRMICKDTIEEKIVLLQDRKKSVAADVIQVDQEKKTFNKKDVEKFFG